MPDNLRISTPINTGEHVGKLKQNPTSPHVDTVNPAKVSSRNTSEQADAKNTLEFSWDRRSVFQKFVERLQQTPGLSQSLQKLLLGNLEQALSTGISSPSSKLLAELMESIHMDQPQILENLMFQQEHSTKFSGELFQVLRDMISQNSSPELEARLGRFLKAYDGYFSVPATMKSVISQLEEILQYIPKSSRVGIEAIMQQLESLTSEQGVTENLKLLKEQLIPQLGKYISASNDFGEVRNKITMLLHDISRLNISSKEEVVARFRELTDFLQYEMNVPSSKLSRMQSLFIQHLFKSEPLSNSFLDTLIKVLTNSPKTEYSAVSQNMIRDTIGSLLLDSSVYMPFNHMFLPIEYKGAFLFSEIWVEKDPNHSASEGQDAENTAKLYLSFDIKDLGTFQAAITLRGQDVDFQIHYPKNLSSKDYTIRQEISKIFTNNGFNPNSIIASPGAAGTPTEIIRKIYERRQSVDVTV